jgi:hypothetical protein
MAFKPYSNLHTDLVAIPREYAMAASTTILKGDAVCTDANGLLIPATNVIAAKFVGVMASESTTTPAATYTKVLVYEDPLIVYEATTTNNTNANQVGVSYDLTNAHEVNNGASAVVVFKVLSLVGVVADKKVLGVFVKNAATL